MLKREKYSRLTGLIRVGFSVLLITFALGSGACSSGGGDSSSVTGSAQ